MKLKIALVATQCESTEASGDLSSSCERLLEVTRNHLASLSADLFFVNEVLMTSSKSPTRDFLEDLHNKVAAVCCDPQLKVTADELRPMSWHKFLATVSRSAHMSLENARDFWAKEKQEVGETENIKPNEVETLKSFQNFTRAMIEENKSRKAKPLTIPALLQDEDKKRTTESKSPEEATTAPKKALSSTTGISSESDQDQGAKIQDYELSDNNSSGLIEPDEVSAFNATLHKNYQHP